MIEVTRGDILKADAEALVNTVNCVGVMGRGVAAQFKRAYPKNFSAYQQACERREVAARPVADRRDRPAREPPLGDQLPHETSLAQ